MNPVTPFPQLEAATHVGAFIIICVFLLGAILLVMQIIRLGRRSPTVDVEIDSKIAKCQQHNDARFTGMARKIDRLDLDLKDRSEKSDKGRQRIHKELQTLAAESAGQEAQISMMNQRQIQMDGKIDRVRGFPLR